MPSGGTWCDRQHGKRFGQTGLPYMELDLLGLDEGGGGGCKMV
jgi:hypothetical protein